ncbi:hypothetical protein [Daejeonella oryzae]|uniref:hypothetical protein n=1 Tax=Daejeonella oryzae TaxID=1122943 RepID=UPI00047907D4|nr:hypothetical protein [Daejeonella oryzae]
MTVKIQDERIQLTQDLKARNKEVDKAYQLIIQSSKSLLLPFESKKYRTAILVQHSKSGKETNLISEFVCFFYNITLATNRAGYRMIYFTYDEEALAKFGLRLYNRAIRQVMKHTAFESTKVNIEDSVRISPEQSRVQSFFINRLANGENDFISIEVVENVTL